MSKNTYTLLDTINTPDDLKKIPITELPKVCEELRSFIIDELSEHPGHFAASLGVVEITVALHYIMNTPYDRIVWDVGHQAYIHKILTGRRKQFHTNRQYKGISGFPKPEESEYDAFGVGHASTSISAGLGMSVAANLKQEKERHIVAVIGDGSMTGGLAFEGLNNASINPNNLLIILNDNQIAIDPIRGGMHHYLVNITTSRTYNQLRFRLSKLFTDFNILTSGKKRKITQITNQIKTSFARQSNIFEGMNIRYFGPVDGHDCMNLARILNEIKDYSGPKVLHIVTKKGKGYKPAEESATEWHAPGKFNKETGERIISDPCGQPSLYQDVFGKTLLELAEKNDKIVGVTPAMVSGCSLNFLMEKMPRRAFDVGIAEGHAVTFSAGMAAEGMIPFCNIYSSFMQRAYDNVIHDVALQKLPVVFCIDRAGLVGPDGATHQGMFDLAYFRCIPNLTIAAPLNELELRNLMYTAQLPDKGSFVIRYPKGKGVFCHCEWEQPFNELPIGKGRCLKPGNDFAILSLGSIGNTATKAIKVLEEEGWSVAHYDMRFLKPIDEELLHTVAKKFNRIVTIEDGVISGGFGSAVLEFLADNDYQASVKRIGLPDRFIEHGTPEELYHEVDLDVNGIANSVRKFLSKQ
ncbi:MAG: 1-deoxy-D-xylulose-5-phosphate synthase [Bacteroidota bacterium]|nr:1-deoxy-D-xylulose-5-phosphate synthase [Bacteroidota bacterium]